MVEDSKAMTIVPLRSRSMVPAAAIDCDAIHQVTEALANCVREEGAHLSGDSIGQFERHKRLVTAVHANSQLWMRALNGVLDERSALPQALKIHITRLAEFSLRLGPRVLRGEGALQPLIDINRSIITGFNRAGALDRLVQGS